MDISELNLQLNKTEMQRKNLDEIVARSQKWINYFSARKNRLVKHSYCLVSYGLITLLQSIISLIFGKFFIAFALLMSSIICASSLIYKHIAIKKFERTIKRLINRQEITNKDIKVLLENELELEHQIKHFKSYELRNQSNQIRNTTNNTNTLHL